MPITIEKVKQGDWTIELQNLPDKWDIVVHYKGELYSQNGFAHKESAEWYFRAYQKIPRLSQV